MNETELNKHRILVVDDEPFNLEILCEHLEDDGYVPVDADSGEAAWEILTKDPSFSAILLDWMMPGISGLELLKKIKQEARIQSIPVIIQTAKADKASVNAGIAAGAYYYLSKPFNKETLLPIVRAAVSDAVEAPASDEEQSIVFQPGQDVSIQTLDEVRQLTQLICDHYPDHAQIGLGLSELLINAVEHGNLGISYDDKGRFIADGVWEDEIHRRLSMDAYKDKRVTLLLTEKGDHLDIRIQDEGDGFDWENYLEFSADRAFDTHGRGIAMANSVSFESVQYLGKGNVVVATVKL